jgi:hypothetical protein
MSTSTYISITNLYLFHHKYYSFDKFGAYIKMENERTLRMKNLTTERMNKIGMDYLSQTQNETEEEVITFARQLFRTEFVKDTILTGVLAFPRGNDHAHIALVLFNAIHIAVEFGIAIGHATADCAALENLMEKETN